MKFSNFTFLGKKHFRQTCESNHEDFKLYTVMETILCHSTLRGPCESRRGCPLTEITLRKTSKVSRVCSVFNTWCVSSMQSSERNPWENDTQCGVIILGNHHKIVSLDSPSGLCVCHPRSLRRETRGKMWK